MGIFSGVKKFFKKVVKGIGKFAKNLVKDPLQTVFNLAGAVAIAIAMPGVGFAVALKWALIAAVVVTGTGNPLLQKIFTVAATVASLYNVAFGVDDAIGLIADYAAAGYPSPDLFAVYLNSFSNLSPLAKLTAFATTAWLGAASFVGAARGIPMSEALAVVSQSVISYVSEISAGIVSSVIGGIIGGIIDGVTGNTSSSNLLLYAALGFGAYLYLTNDSNETRVVLEK